MTKAKYIKDDPHAEREREKYDQPIPSREYILRHLEEVGHPVKKRHLYESLGLEDEEQQLALGYRLKAMLRDAQLMKDRRGRYCLMTHITLKKARVMAHPEGYGFAALDEGGKDLFLSAKQMRTVMHGDRVLVFAVDTKSGGRREGHIHEVIEHANKTVVGRFFVEHGVSIVKPDNKRLTQDITIAPEMRAKAEHGQVVLVDVLAYPSKRHPAIGQVVEILGEHMAPGMEIDMAIHAHDLPFEWPAEVLQEVAALPDSVSEADIKGRADLRSLPFVTIDGEDAKDFDDAVYCERRRLGGWRLWVAIADVSHYVKPGSALDKEAYKRGTSVYFPERVIPMLPEALSNGLCSLKPEVDRLCMISELTISSKGRISRHKFYRAAIHSHARLTYTKVANYLDGDLSEANDTERDLLPHLQHLQGLFTVLFEARRQRGAIEFDSTETKILFDEEQKIASIVPSVRNDAHRLIEECMLAANVATARYVAKQKIPALYRNHEPPTNEKLVGVREFLGELGLKLAGGKKPAPKYFQQTLQTIGERPDKHLIEMVMLRSLSQAVYAESNSGHFGLAYASYTHFTSPIRRYPDLIIHRAIGHCLDRGDIQSFAYDNAAMKAIGEHCSGRERRADEATRDVVSWLKCEYLMDKVGHEYSGTIASVTSFGVFVELNEVYVEGLVHVTSLKTDYYQFDATKHRLIGERTRQVYRLGDPIDVRVVRVDLDERKIDFELK